MCLTLLPFGPGGPAGPVTPGGPCDERDTFLSTQDWIWSFTQKYSSFTSKPVFHLVSQDMTEQSTQAEYVKLSVMPRMKDMCMAKNATNIFIDQSMLIAHLI